VHNLCPDGNMHGIIYRHIGRTGLGWIGRQKSPVFRRGKSGHPSVRTGSPVRTTCTVLDALRHPLLRCCCTAAESRHGWLHYVLTLNPKLTLSPHFLFAEPWKGVGKGMLSPGCHVIVVIRLPISCVSSMAISCHVPAVSMANG